MQHSIKTTADEQCTEYMWKICNKWNYLKLKSDKIPTHPEIDSIEAFIKNHFWGFTKINAKKSLVFKIQHIPWNIFSSTSFELEINAEVLFGKELASFFYQKPLCSFLMDGSYTEISRPVLL